MAERSDRFHPRDRPEDQRSPGQRDRDRVLYTSAFRRLAGVTQVVSPAEGHIFHNRLTHTLEVAQIARRLAEKVAKDQAEIAAAIGGIDPDVTEAAALAHDLGHPPFGHIAETELDKLVKQAGILDGFEGNPQSFRVVTKLAVRQKECLGLNLTRGTLDAILKYPWFRGTGGDQKERKWGAYHTEEREFAWARELHPPGSEARSVEAELMDWADDIAYAVHDVEDFYRAGLIPLDRLAKDRDEVSRFVDGAVRRWREERLEPPCPEEELLAIMNELGESLPVIEPYVGTRGQRAALRTLTAGLIARYIGAIRLRDPGGEDAPLVEIDDYARVEVELWKELPWYYVIRNPNLAAQQFGQRRVIRELFGIFSDELEAAHWALFPARYREQMEAADERRESVRTVCDLIAGMTEQEALAMHRRLTGQSLGSVTQTIMR